MEAGCKAATPTQACVSSWDGASDESLKIALAQTTSQCVETGLAMDVPHDAGVPQSGTGHIGLRVSTRSAYRRAIVKIFLAAVESRIMLSEDLHIRIHSAVQESLMNAVLHGNLRLGSHLRNSLEGLAVAEEAIEAKLGIPEIAQAPISIVAAWDALTLRVVIRDSGEGYTAAAESSDVIKGACGRGLAILHAFCDGVAVLEGGTTVELEFTL